MKNSGWVAAYMGQVWFYQSTDRVHLHHEEGPRAAAASSHASQDKPEHKVTYASQDKLFVQRTRWNNIRELSVMQPVINRQYVSSNIGAGAAQAVGHLKCGAAVSMTRY